MSYEKQNFVKGQILKADHLNHMEDGIAAAAVGVQGPKGDKGDVGPQGPKGDKGDTGPAVALDTTLSVDGKAADAKATGDAVSQLKEDLDNTLKINFNEVAGAYLSGTGNVWPHDSYNYADYVKVKNFYSVYVYASSGSGCNYEFYDENKAFLSGGATPDNNNALTEIIVPENAVYFRISYQASRGMKIMSGSLPLTLNNIEKSFKNKKNTKLTLDDIAWIDGYYLGVSADVKYPHSSFKYSEKIPLKYMTITSVSLHGRTSGVASIVYYDERGGFISSVVGTVIEDLTIPENAEYLAVCVEKSKTNDSAEFIINDFSVVQTVSDYHKSTLDNMPLDQIITDGGMCKIFRSIGVVGDSLSSGEMAYGNASDESTQQYVDMYEYSWIQYMARYCGNTAYNFSAGGLSTRTFFTAHNGKFYNEMMDGNHKCQAYFIALGHNDKNQNIPIGSISDIDVNNPDANADTYYGNYGKIISKIKTVQPHAKIFCICMKDNTAYGQYNNAIKALAELFSNVYVLDMASYAPPLESWEYTQGHGNAMGYLNYSHQISSYVDWIIRHNRNDFKYVQFINTDKEQYIPTN